MHSLDKLPPEPDEKGHYYFGFNKSLPAIFVIQSRKNPDKGRWFPCPSGDVSVKITKEGRLKAYDTPEAALKALRKLQAKGGAV